jgi:predicted phage terminase large subunit-like protein
MAKRQVPNFELRLPPLHSGRSSDGREAVGQQQVFDSTARFKVVCCGRRWGKTHLGVLLCVVCAAKGGRAWWIAPTYPVANIGWRLLKVIVSPIPGIEVRESEKLIEFPNGGSVQVKSGDKPDSLRGESLDQVVFDEVADIKAEAWTEGIRPSLADRKGSALFIGTPRGMANWFYDLFLRGVNDSTGVWQSWTAPTIDNPHIDASEIEDARKDMHPIIYNQEHLAEFVVAGGTVFNQAWEKWYTHVGDPHMYDPDGSLILQHEDHIYEAAPLKGCLRFATVDLAVSLRTSADYTVVAVWALTPGKRICLLDFQRDRMEGPDIVPACQRARARWRLAWIGIERAAFQLTIVQQARRAGLPVKELRADKDKMSRAYTAAAYMEGGRVWYSRLIPNAEVFADEVRAFPLGAHDDCVDTLSYAVSNIDLIGPGPQIVSW